jgi:hypothetical protein
VNFFILIYGKRVTTVTDVSAGGRHAEFCAHKIQVMERNVRNSRNENDIP